MGNEFKVNCSVISSNVINSSTIISNNNNSNNRAMCTKSLAISTTETMYKCKTYRIIMACLFWVSPSTMATWAWLGWMNKCSHTCKHSSTKEELYWLNSQAIWVDMTLNLMKTTRKKKKNARRKTKKTIANNHPSLFHIYSPPRPTTTQLYTTQLEWAIIEGNSYQESFILLIPPDRRHGKKQSTSYKLSRSYSTYHHPYFHVPVAIHFLPHISFLLSYYNLSLSLTDSWVRYFWSIVTASVMTICYSPQEVPCELHSLCFFSFFFSCHSRLFFLALLALILFFLSNSFPLMVGLPFLFCHKISGVR